MTFEIDNYDDIIDSRDVIARIDELTSLLDPDTIDSLDAEEIDEYQTELTELTALAREGESATSDWPHGATLIRDSYFENYARELAEDLDMIKSDVSWPYDCIDWERAASELQVDYTSIEFGDVTYWTR